MKHHLIFINGDPRSGKDTVSVMLCGSFSHLGLNASTFTSIEPVRQMLSRAGFQLEGKTEADRRLLSEVGDSVERHSGFRSRACVKRFQDAVVYANLNHSRGMKQTDRAALILHTREPATIHKVAWALRNEDVRMTTLFVTGRGQRITSNPSDAGVRDMEYDIMLPNAGSLDDLRKACAEVAKALVEGKSL